MSNQEEQVQAPTHKWIVVNDLNRELSPIGYGFQSPIYRPSKFPIDIIGQLLNVSSVTAMFEVFEQDHTLQVPLNNANFRKPFAEIWAEVNPEVPFPWTTEVETIQGDPKVVDAAPVTVPDTVVEGQDASTNLSENDVIAMQQSGEGQQQEPQAPAEENQGDQQQASVGEQTQEETVVAEKTDALADAESNTDATDTNVAEVTAAEVTTEQTEVAVASEATTTETVVADTTKVATNKNQQRRR